MDAEVWRFVSADPRTSLHSTPRSRITKARSSKVFVAVPGRKSTELPTVLINTVYVVEWGESGPQVFKPLQAESPEGETQESPWCSGSELTSPQRGELS